MGKSFFYNVSAWQLLLPALVFVLLASSCSSVKHLKDEEYLLWKNKLTLNNKGAMPNKGELRESLSNIISQQPNSTYMGISITKIPMKLWRYNNKYRKWSKVPDSLLSKSVERPVILDTSRIDPSMQNMKNYLFNQGYFYARIKDTIYYKGKKATVHYTIDAGTNYIINRINYDVDDSVISSLLKENQIQSTLKRGDVFTYSLLEEERSRLTTLVNNNGYRRFNLENINFKLDTLDKSVFRVAASPFENAVNFVAQSKSNKKSTLDIDIIVRKGDDSLSYNRYKIGKVTVYPDYNGTTDLTNKALYSKTINGIEFRYHKRYVLPGVIYKHMFIYPESIYSKADEEKTISRLGSLGVFHYIRADFREYRSARDSLTANIFLTKAQKYDFSTNYEISNGSNYKLGNSLNLNFRNKNFLKGANLLTVSTSGGVELWYDEALGDNVYDRFQLLTTYYGVNASLDFPKFLAPVASSLFSNSNLPHTVVGVGNNVIDRSTYFKLINTSANFSYNWQQTDTRTWTLTPMFINNIRVPYKSASFQTLLDSNEYLNNSYKPTLIEGESISFRFDNSQQRKNRNYAYLRLAFEEAGSLLNGLKQAGLILNDLYRLEDTLFARYTKFDIDARQYLVFRKSTLVLRFFGGLGIPYGEPWAMPYIKQYFAGGPYSLRGWRIRSLGPGRHVDAENIQRINQIDRTGDIKLESNIEYRFPVMPIFAGAVKLNGAIFADAGNIWLSNPDPSFEGGEFAFNKLAQDIAMDVGIGSRFEIASFLTVRLDLAMPVKQPNYFVNNGWVFNQIDFSSSSWRARNLVLNFSIGYPF
jgi:outer membrane protein assembly factor BamA